MVETPSKRRGVQGNFYYKKRVNRMPEVGEARRLRRLGDEAGRNGGSVAREVPPLGTPGVHVLRILQEVTNRKTSGRPRPGSPGLGGFAPPHDGVQARVDLTG